MDPATCVVIIGVVQVVVSEPLRIIRRHVKYIIDFKKYVEDFRKQLALLEAKKNDVQGKVNEIHQNSQEVRNEVKEILKKCCEFDRYYVNDLQYLSRVNVDMVKKCGRYKISKKALKLEEKINSLLILINGELLMAIIPPPITVKERQTNFHESLGSFENIRVDVMNAIKDANTSMIGLCGMGGVGKTTLMERINNDFLTNNYHEFTYVIMVTVSATPNISELQDKIAESVGYIDLVRESETKIKACMLKKRLRREKSILIILDDVWETLDLKEVGIPCGSGENNYCKIVVITRNENVCKQMDVAPIIHMACLDFDESWKLFVEKCGAIESKSIRGIAKDICKECAGLPLAISVVASTLKPYKEEREWNLFLSQLMEYNPKGISNIQEKVYTPLKLSYDHLKRDDFVDSKDLQLCFLFCSLFPEDHEIHLGDLMYYGIGEGFITSHKRVSALQYTLILISKLKGYGLLIDASRGEMYVKMHDVVRDVAIFIATNIEKYGFYTNFKDLTKWPEGGESETRKRISLMGNYIQHVVDHQKFDGKLMTSLLLYRNRQLKTIADSFFKEMKDLLVLDMRRTTLKSLPSSIQNLTNLRVLMVSSSTYYSTTYSMNLQHLSSMEHLSVLVLQDSRISELNEEFGDLVHLKVLDFTNTTIDIIWPNVLSKLEKLEKLLMKGSFNLWDGNNEDGKYFVPFFELDSLKHLYALEVDVTHYLNILSKRAPHRFLQSFADRGQKQHIFFNINFVFTRRYMPLDGILKANELSLKGKLQFPNWILLLMKETEILRMEECKSFQQQLMQNSHENIEDYGIFKNLRELKIYRCENWEDLLLLKSEALKFFLNLEELDIFNICKLKRIIEYSMNRGEDIEILPKVVSIFLNCLYELENVFASTMTPTLMPNGSFQRLKNIIISNCRKLKFIFQWNVAKCLVELERLRIINCSQLEVIIGEADSDYDQVVCGLQSQLLFSKLRIMQLDGLPNLESLWQQQSEKRMELEWPSLEDMTLKNCDKLNRLFWGHQSAPSLMYLYAREVHFEKLIWEDDQAASRFKRVLYPQKEGR